MTAQSEAIRRGSITQKVMTSIAVGPARVHFPLRADDGSYPLVIALQSDYMSDVVKRVEAVGGRANVAVAKANSFQIIEIGQVSPGVGSEIADESNINKELSVGMFMLKHAHVGPNGTRFRFNSISVDVSADSRELEYV